VFRIVKAHLETHISAFRSHHKTKQKNRKKKKKRKEKKRKEKKRGMYRAGAEGGKIPFSARIILCLLPPLSCIPFV
jgi:hypothetical protein